MKKVLIPFLILMGTVPAMAQVKEGKVVYERKINLHKRLPPEAEQMKAMIPEFQTTKMELQFNQTQSLFKNIPEEENQMPTAGDGGPRMTWRFGGGSPNDATFRDYDKEQIVESRELGPKTYLIEDTLRPLKWKIEGDTMTINGYLCYKATTTLNLNQVMGGGMRFGGGPGGSQGGQQRAEGDTARRQQRTMNIPAEQKVEAWFTQDIETSAGPDFFFGLPGLIMKVIVDEGTSVYKVLALDTQAKTTVKAPTSGKKITREEYRKMMQQQMQGMRPPGGGAGGQRIIINQ